MATRPSPPPEAPPTQLSLFGEAAAEPTPAAPPPAAARPQGEREVVLEGHVVGYRLRRGRQRSIRFVVGPEGLAVSAPRWVGLGEVEAALRGKAGWILRKIQEQRERASRLAAADPGASVLLVLPWRGGERPDPTASRMVYFCPEGLPASLGN